MKVSIIIPVYNVSAYIERCVSSVIGQDYKGNIECLIVDDCSSDDSMDKCTKLLENYTGPITFRVLKHEKNRGLSGARNTGTVNSTGAYLFYLDGDDAMTSNCISTLISAAEEHPNAEMVQGSTRCVPDKKYYHKETICSVKYVSDNKWVRYQFYSGTFPVNAWNKLLRRDFVLDNQLFFREGIIHEDELWMFYVAKKLRSVSFVSQETYTHYVNADSIMTSGDTKRSCDSWVQILLSILSDFDEPYYWLQVKRYFYRLLNVYSQSPSECEETMELYRQLFKEKNEGFILFLLKIYENNPCSFLGNVTKSIMLRCLDVKWRWLEGAMRME